MTRKSKLIALAGTGILLLIFIIGYSLNRGSLEIEAQIIYQLGGPQPVARETFYLLNADVRQLADLNTAYESTPLENTYRRKRYSRFLMEEGKPFWTPYVVKSGQTDFKGHAVFENIKPGDYWVMGLTETRGGDSMIWNVKVTIGRGKNTLALSNDNSGFRPQ